MGRRVSWWADFAPDPPLAPLVLTVWSQQSEIEDFVSPHCHRKRNSSQNLAFNFGSLPGVTGAEVIYLYCLGLAERGGGEALSLAPFQMDLYTA